MKRRTMLLGMGLALAELVASSEAVRPAPAKEQTVTLEINGIT